MSFELRDDQIETAPLGANARLWGAKSANDVEPTSFGRESIGNYVTSLLANIALSGSASDLIDGTIPTERLPISLQNIVDIPNPAVGDIMHWNGSQWIGIAAGDENYVLTSQGANAVPVWSVAGQGDMLKQDNLADLEDYEEARDNLGLAIGEDVQAWSDGLDDISSLAPDNGAVILGDGSNWIAQTGDTARASLGLAIGTDVQAFSTALAGTNASFTTDLESKLEGIEALADVTDATNVAAAGAVMTEDIGSTVQAHSSALDAYPDPESNDGDSLGTASAAWSDLYLAGGGQIDWANADVTLTHASNVLAFAGANTYLFRQSGSAPNVTIERTDAHGSGQAVGTINFFGRDSGGAQQAYGQIYVTASDNTAGTEDAAMVTSLVRDGTTTALLQLTGAALRPHTNDGISLGVAAAGYSDVFLASGGVANWGDGNATITHSTGLLTYNVNIEVPDEAYDESAWNESLEVPTKNAVRDKISALESEIILSSDIGVTVQPYSSTLASLASASSDGVSLVTADDYAEMRALLHVDGLTGTAPSSKSARDVLGYDEGIACHTASRTALIGDYSGALADCGSIADIATLTRASTAAYIDRDGVLKFAASNALRYTYDPVTRRPRGLLLEGAATNIFLNSATGVTQNCTVTAAPWTVSFWGTGTITLTDASTDGPLVGTGVDERVSLTFTPSAGSLTLTVSGTCTNVQLELGSVATSYTETEGTTATRAADSLVIGPDTFPVLTAGDGTLYWRGRIRGLCDGDEAELMAISDGTANEVVSVREGTTIAGADVVVTDGGSDVADTASQAITLGDDYAFAVSVRADDLKFYANGVEVATDTSLTMPTIDRLVVAPGTGSIYEIDEIAYIARALTAGELAVLTTV